MRQADNKQRVRAAMDLAWLERSRRGEAIDIGCLRLANAYVVHMPAELFIEYQLAAQRMCPDSIVAMAAYGDYGAGYIGTEISYSKVGTRRESRRALPRAWKTCC